jgi:hypothetical protein
MRAVATNFVLFQIGWFACVLGGDWLALGFTAVALIIHARVVSQHNQEWWLIVGLAAFGVAWDSSLAAMGVLHFEQALPIGIPLWLVCLWLLFASTVFHSMAWLQVKMPLAVVFGAIFGPLSYVTGARLGVAELGDPVMSVAVMAVGWSIILPAALLVAKRLKAQAEELSCAP